MSVELGWIWLEKMAKHFPLAYPILSVFVAIIVFLFYILLSLKIKRFSWEFYRVLEVSATSILIAFQLSGILYILNNIKKPEIRECIGDLFIKLKDIFANSQRYHIIVAFVIIPFMIIDLTTRILRNDTWFNIEPTIWSLLYDIYDRIAVYFTVFLMAILLWIIINLAWVFNAILSDPYRDSIKINIFNTENFGGLKPIRDLIINIIIVYFISISLAIISYVNAFHLLSYDSFLLIILLLMGSVFFFVGIRTIRILFRGRIENEIYKINDGIQRGHQRFMVIVSEGNYESKMEKLNLLTSAMQTLFSYKERMLQIYAKSKGYDLKTIVEFVGSFILPLAAFLEKLYSIGLTMRTILGI